MTADTLRELLETLLIRKLGGGRLHWRRAIGPIRIYSRDTHPHCNWRVDPSGTIRDVEAIERIVDHVSAEHPFVDRN
jgi:hypothetical protein